MRGIRLRAMCLDRSSGKVIHDVEVFHKDDPGKIHGKNSHASPTPVIDGDRVFVHFGAMARPASRPLPAKSSGETKN